ncbi:hypothetical protein TI39_contig4166g00010 [Zymoseptoria brevis]|uniref:Uncharacterized protein n=1 Tax=Zymoseptoria brevis TaxID=1047168 RepID=A0A0F4GBB4_9PEZI|nr:hypothetical protein TI39_contig4166g00010 [Zymoseptoria brevis]
MLRRGVPCNELSKVNVASAPPQQTFQSLSLSISDKTIDQSNKDATITEDNREYRNPNQREVNRSDEALLKESDDTGNFTGLAHLLRKCSGLQELNLKHYSLAYVNPKINELHSRGILRSLESGEFSRLPKLTLEGFTTTEDQLMGILRRLPALRDLSLHNIRLVQGGFQAILDYLSLENETIADLYLASLFEPKIVLFTAPWVREGGYPGSQARWQRGQVSSPKLTYTLHQGRTLDTPAVRSWRQDLRN